MEEPMRLKTKKYDVANYLDSDEMIAAYLDAASRAATLHASPKPWATWRAYVV
jgi:DNA-binding phage protein